MRCVTEPPEEIKSAQNALFKMTDGTIRAPAAADSNLRLLEEARSAPPSNNPFDAPAKPAVSNSFDAPAAKAANHSVKAAGDTAGWGSASRLPLAATPGPSDSTAPSGSAAAATRRDSSKSIDVSKLMASSPRTATDVSPFVAPAPVSSSNNKVTAASPRTSEAAAPTLLRGSSNSKLSAASPRSAGTAPPPAVPVAAAVEQAAANKTGPTAEEMATLRAQNAALKALLEKQDAKIEQLRVKMRAEEGGRSADLEKASQELKVQLQAEKQRVASMESALLMQKKTSEELQAALDSERRKGLSLATSGSSNDGYKRRAEEAEAALAAQQKRCTELSANFEAERKRSQDLALKGADAKRQLDAAEEALAAERKRTKELVTKAAEVERQTRQDAEAARKRADDLMTALAQVTLANRGPLMPNFHSR
jgi:hypothetical protein